MKKNTGITPEPISPSYWDKKHKIRGLHESVRVYRNTESRKYKEDVEQINFISWLRFNHPDIADRCFHVPNETQSAIQYQAKLTKMGRNKGIPDLMFYGLPIAIEMKKTINASVKPEQKKHLNRMAEDGLFVCVCFGDDAAKLAIKDYIEWSDDV
tara:strand:- start:22563 stop:23027 length:465 start_codon:yes stop_codon:yes gene_type:complete